MTASLYITTFIRKIFKSILFLYVYGYYGCNNFYKAMGLTHGLFRFLSFAAFRKLTFFLPLYYYLKKYEKRLSNVSNNYSADLIFLYLACIGAFIIKRTFVLKFFLIFLK